jgi:hypothetical protein
MPQTTIDIKGLKELIDRFEKMPKEVQQAMNKTMAESLRVLQEKTPGYPPKPSGSNYRRTGTLGKSLGMNGGKPTVYSIKGTGANVEGRYGTDLSYAKYVIDEQRQAYMHKQWWWTLDFVARRAKDKVISLWNTTINKIINKYG